MPLVYFLDLWNVILISKEKATCKIPAFEIFLDKRDILDWIIHF